VNNLSTYPCLTIIVPQMFCGNEIQALLELQFLMSDCFIICDTFKTLGLKNILEAALRTSECLPICGTLDFLDPT
jgi:hypothetical protein